MIAIAAHARFSPERMLLAGVAIGAFFEGHRDDCPRARRHARLHPSHVDFGIDKPGRAVQGMDCRVRIGRSGSALPLLCRWLTILPLGGSTARAFGLSTRVSRLVLATIAALMTSVVSTEPSSSSKTGSRGWD
jgi:hypothetical protein